MYRYDVFFEGSAVGKAEVEADGLYWQVRVACAPAGEGLVRASAENISERLMLGVLAPKDGTLVLSRRIARSRFCFYPDTELTLDETPRWSDFSGKAAGWPLAGARYRRMNGGFAVCVPADDGKPFVCMPLFCFFRLVTRQAKRYWLLELDEEYNPKMPDKLPES